MSLQSHTRAVLALGLTAMLAFSACDEDADTIDFAASPLSGQNEVPARASNASGSATFTLDGTTVTFSLSVRALNGITASHIHSGAAGVNGTIRVTLFSGATTNIADGVLASGTFTAADVTGITFDELLNEMRSGNAYVNVHTTAYPTGEIRAQVVEVMNH